jgi:hypothetical protein
VKNNDRDLCLPAPFPTKSRTEYDIAAQLAKTTAPELADDRRSNCRVGRCTSRRADGARTMDLSIPATHDTLERDK